VRRRKAKVVWIPTTPEFSADTGGLTSWNFAFQSGLDYTTQGSSIALEVPVVLDGGQSSPLDLTSSLSDIENSGYRLRRIVGKIYVFVAQDVSGNGDQTSLIGVTAGFIIRRTQPTTGGSLAGTISQAGVNPATIENSMDPWIWRRSWLLGTGPTLVTDTTPGSITGQRTAAQFGRNRGDNTQGLSALDGPHIDQKTARIIGPEERLFLDVSATTVLNDATSAETSGSVVIIYELRVLGSMRSNIGNRRNASR